MIYAIKEKYKIYHIVNPPAEPFYWVVYSVEEAKQVLKTLANLDLAREPLTMDDEIQREKLISAYKRFRQHRGINGSWLIEANVQGLLQWDQASCDWLEWMDENGDMIDSIEVEVEDEPTDITGLVNCVMVAHPNVLDFWWLQISSYRFLVSWTHEPNTNCAYWGVYGDNFDLQEEVWTAEFDPSEPDYTETQEFKELCQNIFQQLV